MATATDSTDQRRKIDPDLLLKLKQEGHSTQKIADEGLASNGEKVAVGSLYKILREHGQGSGRTFSRGGTKGLNVSADVTALRERWQKSIDSLDADIAAENQRHEAALATIQGEADKAKNALTQLDAIVAAVSDGEVTAPSPEPAKSGKSK